MYMPTLARFTSRDPLPEIDEPLFGGRSRTGKTTKDARLEPYAYVGNNPANYIDPSGLARIGVCVRQTLATAPTWTVRMIGVTDTIDLPSPTPAPLKQAAATKILCGAVRTITATYCCQPSCLGILANPITITNDQWATETFEITVDPYGPDQLVVAGPSVPLTPKGWPKWLPGPSFDLWIVSPDPAFWTTGDKLCGIAKAKHPPAFTPDARSPEQEMFPNSFECDSGNIPPTAVPDPPLAVE